MEKQTKEVFFNQYCESCKYKNLDISGDPEVVRDDEWKGDKKFFHDPDKASVCHDCLDQPFNYNSHKPVNYEEAK